MDKAKRKILGIFLGLSMLTTISLTTRAKTEKDTKNEEVKTNLTDVTHKDNTTPKETLDTHFTFDYLYKNKNMEVELKGKFLKDKTKFDRFGYIIQNKTSAKDVINFYIVMKKLFLKYKISDESLKIMFNSFNPFQKEVKLSGHALTDIKSSEIEKFKKLLTNLDRDIKNIRITEQDVKDAKNDLKKIIDSVIKKFKTTYINKYNNLDFKKTSVLIEIAKDKLKKGLENIKKFTSKIVSERSMLPKNLTPKILEELEKRNTNKAVKEIKKTLKNDKSLVDMGLEILNFTKELTKTHIPNLEKHKKQFDEVKYDDVKNLTKDLKLRDNSIFYLTSKKILKN